MDPLPELVGERPAIEAGRGADPAPGGPRNGAAAASGSVLARPSWTSIPLRCRSIWPLPDPAAARSASTDGTSFFSPRAFWISVY